jgi:hypothetical protein
VLIPSHSTLGELIQFLTNTEFVTEIGVDGMPHIVLQKSSKTSWAIEEFTDIQVWKMIQINTLLKA